ncbi:radical SAM protein [Candidatus Margulisiibacteriota bacterium]
MYLAYFTSLGCNFKCPYCHQRSSREETRLREYPFPTLIDPTPIIRYLYDAPFPKGRELAIMGGEATLHPNFKKIIEELADRYFIVVTTNLGSRFFDKFDEEFLPWARTVKVRWNLTYHPDFKDTDEFIRRARKLKRVGHGVYQFAAVDSKYLTPEMRKKLTRCIWRLFGRFDFFYQIICDYQDGVLRPTKEEIKSNPRKIAFHTGVTLENYEQYALYCGQGTKGIYRGKCGNEALIIGPNGDIFMCHSHLYNATHSIGNVGEKKYPSELPRSCDMIGLCNQCDFRGIKDTIVVEERISRKL